MRIPGIGPKGAEAILRARRKVQIRDMASLKKMGVMAERAAPYLLFDGRRASYQPTLF